MNKRRQPWRSLVPFIGVVLCAYGAASLMNVIPPTGSNGWVSFLSLVLTDDIFFALAGIEPLPSQFKAILALLVVLVLFGVVLLRWRTTPPVRKLMAEICRCRWAEGDLRKLSLAVEQSASMVVITDRNGVIEYVNQKFIKVTGYQRDEVVGKTPRLLQSGNTHPEKYRRLWKTISAGGEWCGEFENRKKNGELPPMSTRRSTSPSAYPSACPIRCCG